MFLIRKYRVMTSERILIFSAGANIDKTYSISAEECKPTHVFVLVEKKVLEIANDNKHPKAKEMQNIIDAISRLSDFIKHEGRRDFSVVYMSELTQTEIQNSVLEIRKNHQSADFFFNITAGTALFSTTLFLMGIWLGGKIFITRTANDSPIYLSIPRVSLADLESKPELKHILQILGRFYPNSISNTDLMKQLDIPDAGTKYVKKTNKSVHSKRMSRLIELNLVSADKKSRIVSYCLTPDGEFAYKFIDNCNE